MLAPPTAASFELLEEEEFEKQFRGYRLSTVDRVKDRLRDSSAVFVRDGRAWFRRRRCIRPTEWWCALGWRWKMRLLALLSLSCFFLGMAHFAPKTASSLTNTAECVACTATAAVAAQVARVKMTEGSILWFAKYMCTIFAKEPYAVCDGITEQFRDEFFYVFRQLADEPSRICAALIPGCGDPMDPRGEGWNVPLPPVPKERSKFEHRNKRRSTSTGTGTSAGPVPPATLRVLQLTDIHVDYNYTAGSEAECSDPVCCRSPTTNFYGKVKNSVTAGYWGTAGKCDTPYRTIEHLLHHVNSTEKIDYIMISGDLVNHADWKYSWAGHIKVLRNLSSLVKRYFPVTPTYWALGNHEGVPVNSFAPHRVDSAFWPTKLYDELTEMNKPWVRGAEAENSSRYRGSWSTLVTEGLRMISINTGFCINTNFFLYLNQSDPDGTMSWFVQELHKAEMNGEFVHVMSHIPPGYSDCLEGWSRNYYRAVQRFSSTITGQFFGHVHYDYVSLFYEDMGNVSSVPINVAYVSPSVTTFDYLNPAYRIYTIDAENDFQILDHETYWTDLAESNEYRAPRWELLYRARQEYGMRDLSPGSWQKVVDSIYANARGAYDRFFELAFRNRNWADHCDASCQRSMLCSLRGAHHNDQLYCPESKLEHMLETNRIERK